MHDYNFGIFPHISGLKEHLNEVSQVLIDVPIGLKGAQTEERACDKEARASLKPPRASSVFPAPSRYSLNASSYEEASAINKIKTGRGLSKQSFAISQKIKEVDEYLRRTQMQGLIREMHPEVSFWALNKRKAMLHPKKTESGIVERLNLIYQNLLTAREIVQKATETYPRKELARDDIIDALVGAITAAHHLELDKFPKNSEVDDLGLEMEMVFWQPKK